MQIDFNLMEQKMVENFKGGSGHLLSRIVSEGNNKFLVLKFPAGAGIGMHTHEKDCEVVYVLKGSGVVICDDEEQSLYEGVCHFCPKGSSHSIVAGRDGLELFGAVIEQ